MSENDEEVQKIYSAIIEGFEEMAKAISSVVSAITSLSSVPNWPEEDDNPEEADVS